jgi:hypothetical protein
VDGALNLPNRAYSKPAHDHADADRGPNFSSQRTQVTQARANAYNAKAPKADKRYIQNNFV